MEEMPIFIVTLRSLYANKKIDVARVKAMLKNGAISVSEYDFILGKPTSGKE